MRRSVRTNSFFVTTTDYFIFQAVKTDNKLLFENKGKFLLVHSSSGYKHALKEVLQDPAVLARLVDTKVNRNQSKPNQIEKKGLNGFSAQSAPKL